MHSKKWHVNIFIFFLLCLSCGNCQNVDKTSEVILYEQQTENYVDPHSFYYSKYSKTGTKIASRRAENDGDNMKSSCYRECNEYENKVMGDIPDEFYSRRIMNLLLSQVDFQTNEESDSLIGIIAIKITSPQLEKLKNFGKGELSIRDIDSIISNIFKPPRTYMFQNACSSIQHLFMKAFIHKDTIIGVLGFIYLTWIILTTRWSMWKLSGMIMMIFLAASFVISWHQLVKEADIKQLVKQTLYMNLPHHCNPSTMSWWDITLSIFSSFEECHKHYEAKMENPFLQVTPFQALSHMLATTIQQPAKAFGKALGDFTRQATQHLNAPIRMIIEPVLILGIIIIIIFSMYLLACQLFNSRLFSQDLTTKNNSLKNDISLKSEERKPIELILNVKIEHKDYESQLTIITSEQDDNVNITPENTIETKKEVTNDLLQLVQSEESHSNFNLTRDDSNLLNTLSPPRNDECVKTHNSRIEVIIPESGSGDN